VLEDDPNCEARLIIKDAAKLTPAMKVRMSQWLMKEAKDLVKEGDLYTSGYVANYRLT
jgi:hypothetical protein